MSFHVRSRCWDTGGRRMPNPSCVLPCGGYGRGVSQEDVERVRTIIETFSADKVDELLQTYDPHFVYHPRSVIV